MIYTKQIENITWQDIEDFCNQRIPQKNNIKVLYYDFL